MSIQSINQSEFDDKVLKADKPVLVDFYADWCGPCKALAPTLEEVSQELAGQAEIVKINVDENPDLASKFGVRSIPTLLFFKAGDVKNSLLGNQSKKEISSALSSLIG